jgi:hypothetical protein
MSGYDDLKVVVGVLATLGGGGAIVLGLSGWLGRVWAERMMEKERHDHAEALESDRAKYGKELEELKANYEQTHRRLQAELDKTIFGHQLRTQAEFNALTEMWKKVPPLESAVRWASAEEIDQLVVATEGLESVLETFGPFVSERVYENLLNIVNFAYDARLSILNPASPREVHEANEESFEVLRRQAFEAISDRIKELSQGGAEHAG